MVSDWSESGRNLRPVRTMTANAIRNTQLTAVNLA